jgi:hypothetical protein
MVVDLKWIPCEKVAALLLNRFETMTRSTNTYNMKYRDVSGKVRILYFFEAEIYYANLIVLGSDRLNYWHK